MRIRDTARAAKAQCGFTLVELLITISILLVLATLAMPSIVQHMRTAAIRAAATNAQAILNQARAEAIKKNCSIVAARTTGGFTFSHSGCNAPFANGVYTLPGMSAGGIYKTSEEVAISGPASVTFQPLGTALAAQTFTLTHTRHNTTMRVFVELSGRIRIQQ